MKLIYVAVVTIFFTIFRTSFVSSDEAVNLQMVRNMEESRAFIVKRLMIQEDMRIGQKIHWVIFK